MIKHEQIDQIETKFQEAEIDYYDRGEFEEALDLYSDILTELLHLKESPGNTRQWIPSILVVIERLVDLSVLFSNFSTADNLLESMVKLYEEEGDRYGVDYTLVKRIHINLMFGHLREAYTILESMSVSIGDIHTIGFSLKGLQKWEACLKWPNKTEEDHHALLVRLYLVMGIILASLGQYSDSIAAYERGIFQCNKYPSDFVQEVSLPLHIMLAEANLEKGELNLTASQIEKLHKTIDPLVRQTQPGHYIHLLELIGKLNLLRGEFGNVLTCFKDIVSFCQERNFTEAAVQTALNLVQVMILMNQVGEAKKILDGVKDHAQKAGDQITALRVEFLSDLAYARSHSLADKDIIPSSVTEIWVQKERKTCASDENIKNIDPFDLPQSNNYLTFFEDRSLGFYWHLAHSRIVETEQYLFEIIETFKNTDSKLIQVRLGMMQGILSYYKNIQNPLEAENILNKTISTFKKLGLNPDLWQALRFRRWCAARLNRDETEQNKLIMQTDSLLTEMAESLDGADRAIFLLNKWTVEEEKLKVKIEQLQYLDDKYKTASWLRPFLKWRLFKQLNALAISIDAKKDLEARRLLKEEKIAEQEKANRSFLWALLKPSIKKMTLSFLVLPDRVLITHRRWFSFGFRVIPITRIEIREKVQQWHQLMVNLKGMRDIMDNSAGADIGDAGIDKLDIQAKEITSEIVYKLQIPGLLKKLPAGSSLKIIPDDVLHGFPFAAIFYDGKYLVERYALSIDFDHHLLQNKPQTPKVKKALLVGVAIPVMDNPPLPGVSQEIERIETWFQSCNVELLKLLNHEADKKTVLQHLSQCNYFHIACHGTFKPDKPGESGLLLSPTAGEMEMLSIRELSKLNLAGLEHATLSSCWSADNFITPGRIIISLPETFRRAGAGSILGSLWPLHDSFAIAFMERFYKYLEKYPRDIALQKTQLDCIHNKLISDSGINSNNPSHWAAFNLYGISTRLSIAK